MRLSAAESVSRANCAAWVEPWGRPPTAHNDILARRFRASFSVFPTTNSVNAEAQAIAATHPLALNRPA